MSCEVTRHAPIDHPMCVVEPWDKTHLQFYRDILIDKGNKRLPFFMKHNIDIDAHEYVHHTYVHTLTQTCLLKNIFNYNKMCE
jgi:hypothetical protein